MKKRGQNLVMALLFSTVLMVGIVLGYQIIGQETIRRVFQMLGGNMPGGVIQFVTYIAFFWGIFEIRERMLRINYEEQSFSLSLLPEQEQWVLSPDDVNELKIKMIDHEKKHKFLLTDMVKKACTKFRSNRSVGEVLDLVNTLAKINLNRAESSQSMIRYLAWAMPSVGFIGTILGIAQSLGFADQASDPEKLKLVTSYMYVAFDTTLVALILSIVMMWLYHSLQEREEDLHSNMEEYVIENLVNRIHLE